MAASKPTPVQSWPSLVTPFTPGQSCYRLVTSDVHRQTYTYGGTTRTSVTITIGPDTANPSYSACEPPGWDVASRFFSPGFCPPGSVYHAVTATTSSSTRVTQAYCCPEMLYTYSSLGHVYCTTSVYDHSTYYVATLPALTVQWQNSDTSLASTDIPKLITTSYLRTWDPNYDYDYDSDYDYSYYYSSTTTRGYYGYTTTPSLPTYTGNSGAYPYPQREASGMDAKTRAVVIAVPIVVVLLLLLGLVGGIIGYKRSQRRAALLEKTAPEASEAGSFAAQEANIAQPAPAVVNQSR